MDEALELDQAERAAITKASELRAEKNKITKSIGALMREGKKDEAAKAKVKDINAQLSELEATEKEKAEKLKEVMMQIPNFIDAS